MKRILLILALAISTSGLASAAPVSVKLQFPQGLTAGKESTITATVDGEGASSIQGAPLAVIFDGRQNSVTQQIDLGTVGGKLQGKFTPTEGPYRVSVRFKANGRNYAFAADRDQLFTLPLPSGEVGVNFDTGNPVNGFRLPIALIGWFLGAMALCLVALRSKQFLF
jgi:hypothetical protein